MLIDFINDYKNIYSHNKDVCLGGLYYGFYENLYFLKLLLVWWGCFQIRKLLLK